MVRRERSRLFLAIIIFLSLTVYTLHWMNSVLTLGLDFQIYYNAVHAIFNGGSAYLPYEIGRSFVYPPAVLTALSPLAGLPFPAAFAIWSGFSLAAYGLAIYLVFRYIISNQSKVRQIRLYFLIFILFAPFLENLYVGQINAFVVLLLIACLLYAERDQELIAGVCLAIAILLKTSPGIFLLYFLALRQFRVIVATLITLAGISLIAFIQFGPQAYFDFVSVLGFITGGRVELADYYNPSAIAVTYRILMALGLPAPAELITWIYRLLFGGVFVLLMLRAWRRTYSTHLQRYWLFAIILILMTVLSPLVWYHHNVFLLLPLCLALRYQFSRGVAILILFQAERVLYNITPTLFTGNIDALRLFLALTAGTATLGAQMWLLLLCLRQLRTLQSNEKLTPVPQA